MEGYAINRRGSSVWSAWEGSQKGSRKSTEAAKVIREPLMDGYKNEVDEPEHMRDDVSRASYIFSIIPK